MSRPNKYNTVNKDKILEIVKSIDYDFCAKDIENKLKESNEFLAISTIYRIVDELLDEELIIKILDNENTKKYRYVTPCDEHEHLLLKCCKCSRVIHVSCDNIKKFNSHIFKEHKFSMNLNKVFLPGICEKCEREEEK